MEFPKKTVSELTDLTGKRVLVRVDFNVPLDANGGVTDTTRLEAAVPTISKLLEAEAIPVLMSHLGRPGGEVNEELRLKPVVEPLSKLLDCKVKAASDTVGSAARQMVSALDSGEVGLLENLRFQSGEKANDSEFARQLAQFGEVYVSDAFGTAHRAHASMTGVPEFLRPAVGGELLREEYERLTEVRDDPARPFMALLGGAKVSDKLEVIEHFLQKADVVLVGGAMAYTFSLAQGGEVGESLVEPDFLEEARRILESRGDYRGELVLPEDNVIMDTTSEELKTQTTKTDAIPEGWEGMDIGPRTRQKFIEHLQEAKMVFWNGPMGAFEMPEFAEGTAEVARSLAELKARVIVGGGDSAAAIKQSGYETEFHHISTGGGASLQLVQGEDLPGVEILDDK